MSMKKPASLLAFVGALALVVTGPASVASPMLPGHLPAQDTPASSPVGIRLRPAPEEGTARSSAENQPARKFSPRRIFFMSRPVRVVTSSVPTRPRKVQ